MAQPPLPRGQALGYGALLLAVGAWGVGGWWSAQPPPPAEARCHYGHAANGALLADPAPGCTPGRTAAAVTQATLATTICVRGYTQQVRPPVSVTSRLKAARMAAYGVGDQDPANYELDHALSLEAGGATGAAPGDEANLWPQPYAEPYGARAKDRAENEIHRRVCLPPDAPDYLTLAAGQAALWPDWTVAYALLPVGRAGEALSAPLGEDGEPLD